MQSLAIRHSIFDSQQCLGVVLAFLPLSAEALAENPTTKAGRTLGRIDVIRIRELHHLTDTFGDQIWPGFDTRKIPVAINNEDREELLVGHPDPPKEYRPLEGFELNGQRAWIRDGVSRYGPRGGGWAVEIGGQHSAYVSTLENGRDTEGYLSLLLHECFHCFQRGFRQRADGAHGNLPEDDPVYSAMLGLESRLLNAALEEQSEENVREFAKLFVAVRHHRREGMPENLILREGEDEFNEGTATYSQARLYQLLAQKGGIKPLGEDPQYRGFPNARRDYDRMIAGIVPPRGLPITFFHSMYKNGMAQCLLLDRVRPGWKEEMREKGMTQSALLGRQFPLEPDARAARLVVAKERFRFGELLAEQQKVVGRRLDLIRRYINASGRLYRVHHGKIVKPFKWQPVGPVYHVPNSLEIELAATRRAAQRRQKGQLLRTVWVGGIRRFEKEGLLFKSANSPVVFGPKSIEWIDGDPAADDSDLNIESRDEDDGVYLDVRIKTDGFTLELKAARIEWSRDIVDIYPVAR